MKLLTILKNEWLLLWHDKPSLIILFIMPMFLVLVLTLINSSSTHRNSQISVLLLNQGTGSISKSIHDELHKLDFLKVTDVNAKNSEDIIQSQKNVASGKYQGLIILPKGLSAAMLQQSADILRGTTANKSSKEITINFDPTIKKDISDSLKNSLKILIQQIHIKLLTQGLSRVVQHQINPEQKWVTIKTQFATAQGQTIQPNDVQQSVPAWTLFGMFLIIIPLAGVLVKERQQGILIRLQMFPVRKINFIAGRVLAYTVVNLIQLILMFSIGVFVMPWFDLPALNVAGHLPEIFVTGLGVALAATGFGVFIGSWSKSYEQAAAIGPTLIVIAAAVGGIMAPPYLMPKALSYFTEYSPLYWGQDAFLKILVRGSNFKDLLPNLIKLYSFAMITIVLASLRGFRR